MKNTVIFITILVFFITIFGCKTETKKASEPQQEITEEISEKLAPEITLFDGTNTDGWRVFNGSEFPQNWIIENGTLKCLGTAAIVENGGDLVFADKEFENFELTLEWKISKMGNSGIFYHVKEGKEYHAPYQTGPEYQILDDASFPEDHNDTERAGADYAMYPAVPSKKTVKPAGEWNNTKIVFSKKYVQHWINGQKVVEFVPWSDDWRDRKEASKWKSEVNYGAAKSGLIGLQDHGQAVWYRNIKIRELVTTKQ